ncbi:MAG: TldD/PmbA family protein [Candidatus Cloacimonetes bacterium]|nr:TldD/PmbA family protein [Candidatus Cloacimonadota bacterium]MBS3766990.1 TldD/PmbA family protein [Candidatus Cloacimonadota bacterium]
MKKFIKLALKTIKKAGASYGDIRIIESRKQRIDIKNGENERLDNSTTLGFGIRVIANGALGFASSSDLSGREIRKVAKKAVQVAKASAKVRKGSVKLAPEPVHNDIWTSPYLVDPFQVPMDEKLSLLMQIDKILRQDDRIKIAHSFMSFWNEHQWFASSEGSFIEQNMLRSGCGFSATAVEGDQVQTRSYPQSHGGQHSQMGYELILGMPLKENAERVREEAIALLSADECPQGEKDLIIGSGQLALQIHESIGHPSELDRVIGMEANYAGRSFVTTDLYKDFHYGSSLVNIVADATLPTGLATFGYDDDGVRAQRYHIIQQGLYKMYLTNRELAHVVDENHSRGCNRADGFNNIPMIRMINISLMPHQGSLDDLIADTKDGLFVECNKSWSIDQRRLNFQFSTEIGWEIKNGKKTKMVKNATYQGITPQFWQSCDAICGQEEWQLWGVPNCGKGQPGQTAEISHGAAPARFRNVTVGVDK